MAGFAKACTRLGCAVVGRPPSCELCANPDVERESAAKRGYGHRWRKLRLMVLRSQPVCAVEGCTQAAVDVDHIIPKRDGGLDDLDNLQGLCKSHHSQKTASGL